ncbi:IS3 family transposase [Acuticoccus sediminis]|uniref:IS3 family transposase n=1 Tax=Acuticoccus sediminis TaxID=2184697 RepID=A0A8B2NTF0_9HYPH|nr:IS3 family transposase [Acuticoccus sediminis]
MTANQAVYPIQTMCRAFGVSRAGFYAWRDREPSRRARSDAALAARIRTIHKASRESYGAPRIHAELKEAGVGVGRKRIARLMKEEGLAGVSRRRGTRTTFRDERVRPAADLVDRNFRAEAPDRLWVADITYVPTWAGFLYLAVVLDAFSRRIVGWSMGLDLKTQLVLDALNMALTQRRPTGVIHHSDQGSQLGLKRSLQRSAERGCNGRKAALGAIDTEGSSFAGAATGCAAGASAGVLVGDRRWTFERGRRHRCRRIRSGGSQVVPGGRRHATIALRFVGKTAV